MKKVAIFPGTFDPITKGHQEIIEKGLELFDKVIILVAKSPTKNSSLTKNLRLEILNEVYKQNNKVECVYWDGLIVDFARKNKVNFILRGLRSSIDFEHEYQMATMNNHLDKEVQTVFMITSAKNYFVSSSLVREIYNHGGDISDFVSEEVYQKLDELKKG